MEDNGPRNQQQGSGLEGSGFLPLLLLLLTRLLTKASTWISPSIVAKVTNMGYDPWDVAICKSGQCRYIYHRPICKAFNVSSFYTVLIGQFTSLLLILCLTRTQGDN
jgi:hypothetical protein